MKILLKLSLSIGMALFLLTAVGLILSGIIHVNKGMNTEGWMLLIGGTILFILFVMANRYLKRREGVDKSIKQNN
jgi:hypothetical protein